MSAPIASATTRGTATSPRSHRPTERTSTSSAAAAAFCVGSPAASRAALNSSGVISGHRRPDKRRLTLTSQPIDETVRLFLIEEEGLPVIVADAPATVGLRQ